MKHPWQCCCHLTGFTQDHLDQNLQDQPQIVWFSFWNEDGWQGEEAIASISASTLYQINHQHHVDQPDSQQPE